MELRYFGGLKIEETGEVLGVSPVTVKRDWAPARAWLYRELAGGVPKTAEPFTGARAWFDISAGAGNLLAG